MKLHIPARPDWPALNLDQWNSLRTSANVEPVAIALDQGFIAAQSPRPLLLYVSRLFPDGYLPVPLEVVELDGHVPVFIYPAASPEAAGHFEAARALLAEKGLRAVYCAPEPLAADAPPVNPLRPFLPEYLGLMDGPRLEGRCGMWWPTPEDPVFSQSPAFGYFDRLYSALDGIESYVFATLADAFQLVRGAPRRVTVPEKLPAMQITGPDLRQMYFSASLEKSMRFMFALDTPSWYRDTFWRLFCEYVEGMKQAAQTNGWTPDPDDQRRSLGWWRMFKSNLPALEKQSTGEFIFGVLQTVG